MSNQYWHKFPVKRGWDSIASIYRAIGPFGHISGSYAAFMASPEPCPILPNDVDVFARSEKAALEAIHRLMNRTTYYLDGQSTIAYTMKSEKHDLTVQVIKPHPSWKTFPDDFMNAFDMDVCRAVLVSPTEVLADDNVGLRDAKLLLINDPLRSLKRVMKYHARGVNLTDRELIKLFQAWEMATPERRAEIMAIAQGTVDDPEFFEPHTQEPSSDGWNYDEDDYYRGE